MLKTVFVSLLELTSVKEKYATLGATSCVQIKKLTENSRKQGEEIKRLKWENDAQMRKIRELEDNEPKIRVRTLSVPSPGSSPYVSLY